MRGPGNEPTEWQVINGPETGRMIYNNDPRQLLHANELVNIGEGLYFLRLDGTAIYDGPNNRRHRTWQP